MEKRSPYLDKMLEGVKTFVVDESAVSRAELQKELCCGHSKAREFITERVESGAWEEVRKHKGHILIPAYRMKK